MQGGSCVTKGAEGCSFPTGCCLSPGLVTTKPPQSMAGIRFPRGKRSGLH